VISYQAVLDGRHVMISTSVIDDAHRAYSKKILILHMSMASARKFWEVRSIRSTQKSVDLFSHHHILFNCHQKVMMTFSSHNKKLSYRKETVQLLHNIEIRILH